MHPKMNVVSTFSFKLTRTEMSVIWWLLCGAVTLVAGSLTSLNEEDLTIDEAILNAYESPEAADFIQDANTLLVELDILLSPEQWEERVNPNHRAKRAGLNYGNWPNNTVPYFPYFFRDEDLKKVILGAMEEYHRYTCVRFRPTQMSDDDYIYFRNETGCSATLGYRGGGQIVNLATDCKTHGVVVHELGHTLGLHHEQTRPDRDEYVYVNKTNIIGNQTHNFDKMPDDEIDTHQIPYDYLSIMHYGNDYFSIDKSYLTIIPRDKKYMYRIGQHTGLSYEDIKLLNLKYGCNGRCGNKKCPEDGFLSKDCTCWCKRNIEFGEPVALCDTGARVPGGKADGKIGKCEDTIGRLCKTFHEKKYCEDISYRRVMMRECRDICGWCTPEWLDSNTNKENQAGGGKPQILWKRTCDQDVMRLSCQTGKIRIRGAMYGRQRTDVCQDERSNGTGCKDPDSLNTIKKFCEGKANCGVAVYDYLFPNVCPHLSKYLEVHYWCEQSNEVKTTVAPTLPPTVRERTCDKDVMRLSCQTGKIRIRGAMYGRQRADVCQDERSHGTGCKDPNSLNTIKKLCKGRTTCKIAVYDFLFSYVCPHLSKYLEVDYWCEGGNGRVTTTVAPITTTTPAATTTTIPPPTLPPIVCRDRHPRCREYLAKNPRACQNVPLYMGEHCKRSCRKCGRRKYSRGPCRDANKNCGPWVKRGMCDDNKSYMQVSCAKSCGFCGRRGNRNQ